MESHVAKTLAFQVRAFREKVGWSQQQLADALQTSQNAVYRLEAAITRPNISTLQGLAGVMDVGLVVRFVPYSELIDWVSGTPRVDRGLRQSVFELPSFDEEFNSVAPTRESADIWSLGEVQTKTLRASGATSEVVQVDASNNDLKRADKRSADDIVLHAEAVNQ